MTFLNRSYGQRGVNRIELDGLDLTLNLWGNANPETLRVSLNAGNNWGLDWHSDGPHAVPAPGAALLGSIGLGLVGMLRRRFGH